MNKKEIKAILSKMLVLGFVMAFVFYLSRPITQIIEVEKTFSEIKLSENREIVTIKSDSLVKYLKEIQTEQPDVFEIDESDSRLELRALDEKPFNTIFFDGEYLSRFDKIENSGIEKSKNMNGFSLSIEKKSGIRIVRIPTEIIHSIQLNKR